MESNHPAAVAAPVPALDLDKDTTIKADTMETAFATKLNGPTIGVRCGHT